METKISLDNDVSIPVHFSAIFYLIMMLMSMHCLSRNDFDVSIEMLLQKTNSTSL